MEPYQKSLLEQIAKQTEENNHILKSLRNSARWATFFGFIKLVIILGPLIAAYYYLAPHYNDIKKFYATFLQQVQTLQGINSDLKDLKKLPSNFDTMMKTFPKIQQ